MSQEVNFQETTVDKIIRLLKAWEYGNYFREFIYGDDSDREIGEDMLPCIIVELLNADFKQGPTSQDSIVETVKIMVILNRKSYMSDFDDETWGWKKKLELMVQGNDPVTQINDPTTLLGVLRTNFTLGNYATNQTFKCQYGEVGRSGMDETTGEAWIRMTVERLQTTPLKV